MDLAAFVRRPRRRHRSARAGRKGRPGGRAGRDLTRDAVLDNITLYWLTNTGVSAARLYWENKAGLLRSEERSIPSAISVFPDERYQAPRSWAERAYPDNLIHYNQLDEAGTSRPGNSPSCSRRRCERPSGRSVPDASDPAPATFLRWGDGWLNSEPLGPTELRGHVVLVDFWTLTCINWLRQEPYVRAWSQAYRDEGLVVIGVHTPEFSFEHEIDRFGCRYRSERSTTRSHSTTTTGSGRRSTTTTGRRCTSSTPKASSATSTSARGATRSPSASSSSCWASSANSSPSTGRRRGRGRLGAAGYAGDLSRIRARRELRFAGRRGPATGARTRSRSTCASTTGRSPESGRSARARRARPGRREHRLPLPCTRRAPRAVIRRPRADSLPRAARRRGPERSHGVDVDGTGTGCSRTDASISSCARPAWSRAHARDHVPRAGRRGVRVHVRVGHSPRR